MASAKSLPITLALFGVSLSSASLVLSSASLVVLSASLVVLSASLVACDSSQAASFTEPMILGGREVSAATLNQGHDLYFRHCVSCHGQAGAGDGPAARHLEFPPRDFRSDDALALPTHEALVERIRSGVPERGMPTWKGMRDDDLSALADYLKTFSPRWKDADA